MVVISLLLGRPAPAEATGASISIHSAAACKDTTTVAVIGTTGYPSNRVQVQLYFRNALGQYVYKAGFTSATFGAGPISVAAELNYAKEPVAAGSLLRVDVRLERLSGGSYVDVLGVISLTTTAADKSCVDACSVTVDTTDAAPSDGTLTLRSHYGSWFRPEGRLQGTATVSAGRPLRATFVGIPCGWTVRPWYYPKTGDTTPKMLPSQYWPSEFAATVADGTNPYTTSFAQGVPPANPLEANDPFVVR
jgi:hypothetical protein